MNFRSAFRIEGCNDRSKEGGGGVIASPDPGAKLRFVRKWCLSFLLKEKALNELINH